MMYCLMFIDAIVMHMNINIQVDGHSNTSWICVAIRRMREQLYNRFHIMNYVFLAPPRSPLKWSELGAGVWEQYEHDNIKQASEISFSETSRSPHPPPPRGIISISWTTFLTSCKTRKTTSILFVKPYNILITWKFFITDVFFVCTNRPSSTVAR